jgi:ribosome-associated protein
MPLTLHLKPKEPELKAVRETEPTNVLEVGASIRIPMSELMFRFVRSSGPGGQHVNKTSTQVELTFDIAASAGISEADKRWLLSRLGAKLDTSGLLQIASQEHRSQLRNKTEATRRLVAMLEQALIRPKKRKPTKPSKSAKEKRLKSKKIVAEKKSYRSRPSQE